MSCPRITPAAEPGAGEAPPFALGAADAWLLAGGAALNGVGRWVLDPRTRDVPAPGLDRDDVGPGWDRRSILVPNDDASSVSTLFLAGAALTPYLGTFAGGDPHPWNTRFHLAVLQTESVLLSMGAGHLLKVAFSRPRPYTYLADSQRPDGPSYATDGRHAFESFPSGHATIAWSTSLAGVTFMDRRRPDLPPWVHFLGGMAAGGMATSTSLLRVDAAQHFPTDIAAGFLLGGTVGTGLVALRVPAGEGASRALLTGLAGAAVGTVIAFLLTPPTSPWVE